MSKKYYSMYGEAIDKEGKRHVVTIVGLYTKKKVAREVTENMMFETTKKEHNAKIVYTKEEYVRNLRYAFSICCEEDEFKENVGISIAKGRLKKRPLGELSTTFSTSLCDDQIKHILLGELCYISANIDKFISKTKKE